MIKEVIPNEEFEETWSKKLGYKDSSVSMQQYQNFFKNHPLPKGMMVVDIEKLSREIERLAEYEKAGKDYPQNRTIDSFDFNFKDIVNEIKNINTKVGLLVVSHDNDTQLNSVDIYSLTKESLEYLAKYPADLLDSNASRYCHDIAKYFDNPVDWERIDGVVVYPNNQAIIASNYSFFK